MRKVIAATIAFLSIGMFDAHAVWVNMRHRQLCEGSSGSNSCGNFDHLLIPGTGSNSGWNTETEPSFVGEAYNNMALFLYDNNGKRYAAFCYGNNTEALDQLQTDLVNKRYIDQYTNNLYFWYAPSDTGWVNALSIASFERWPGYVGAGWDNKSVYEGQNTYWALCTLNGWVYYDNSSSGICSGMTQDMDGKYIFEEYGGISFEMSPTSGVITTCRFNKCSRGYYGEPDRSTGSCTQCPIMPGVYTNEALTTPARYTTAGYGARTSGDCYLPTNTTFYDGTGKVITVNNNCTAP